MASTLRDFVDDGNPYSSATLASWEYQGGAVTAQSSYILTSVKVLLSNTNATGTFRLDMYATDAAHKPTGPSLASSGDIVPPGSYSRNDYEFTLTTPLVVVSGTEYAWVVDGTSLGSPSTCVMWGSNSNPGTFQLGLLSHDGVAWTVAGGFDHFFEFWGADPSAGGNVATMHDSWAF